MRQAKFNYDFMGKRKIALVFSLLLVLGAVLLWISRGEEKYGVDFTGGHEIVVSLSGEATSESLRRGLEAGGLPNPVVQTFEGANEFSIRLSEAGDAAAIKKRVQEAITAALPGQQVEILDANYVGPTIGEELRKKAIWATALGMISILVYLTIRFEFAFALGAVVAVFHDVIVATGIYLAVGQELTMTSLAAALTILGYSVNDTIVIFDRVREEIMKRKDFDLVELMNSCINATLSRTIITSLLTLFSAVALLIFGGGAISELSIFLVAGIIVGSYSTIYIASPVVLWWVEYRRRAASKSPKGASSAARA